MPFQITPNVHVERDASGNVRHLQHVQEPYATGTESARELASRYLREVATYYGIEPGWLLGLEAGTKPGQGPFLEHAADNLMMETATVTFVETYRGLPIWEAGISVTMQHNPLRVVSSWSTLHLQVDLHEPKGVGRGLTPEDASPERTAELLGLSAAQTGRSKERRERPASDATRLRVNGTRALIYRFNPHLRSDPESRITSDLPLSSGPPTLDLPSVPEVIRSGSHYIVTEVLFTLALPDWGELHWRAFFERHTGAVLYLRALVACANGLIYRTDPMTAAGGPPPTGPAAALDVLRVQVNLLDLPPQIGGAPVSLGGRFVRLADFSPPAVAPPTEQFGHFLYNVSTRNFSAVNAYYHVDELFRLMESIGFDVASYFDETSFNPGFPLPVDHAGFNDMVNAMAPGNSTGTGSGGFVFGLAAAGTLVGIADDPRVVAHEFCHALLWDSVHSPNFGFAHSAGDSLGAILNDPGTQAPDRFVTFPWINIGRRHDRGVAAGWAWGGANDFGGYSSEQILCTTLFRAYRSTGGDSTAVGVQLNAARYIAYFIIRAIGSLATSPITPTPNASVFATALMNADIGTAMLDDQPGGCCHKVVRWAFEQQGLYQPPGAPVPVVTPGAPPPVDVYIDDGRAGQYQYHDYFWENASIWNRHAPDGGPDHQTPVVNRLNHAYVRVRNRGTQPATSVVVRGHHCRPAAGLVWPDDFTPLRTAAITVPGVIAPGHEVVVGPFQWVPRVTGHECLLMSASALGDLANYDPATFFPSAAGPTPLRRLVPFDNNIGQRALIPVAGGGGRRELEEEFEHRRFWVLNPFGHTARMTIEVRLPAFLAIRGWQVAWDGAGAAPFSLGPRGEREVRPRLISGQDFTSTDVTLAGTVAVRFVVWVDELVVGGLTYVLDPDLRRPAREIEELAEPTEEEEEEEEEEDERHRHRHVHLEADID